MKLWIVGRFLSDDSEGIWEFCGVFDDEELAKAACRDASYFVGPAELNKILPEETIEWPGQYYPIEGE